MEGKNRKRVSLVTYILSLIIIGMICVFLIFTVKTQNKNNQIINPKANNKEDETQEINAIKEEYIIKTNQLSNFDLSFLKLENTEKNKVYSPLSIKYALKMLQDGTTGQANAQISRIIKDYPFTKYSSNEHLSLANAIFINDNSKDDVKEDYINTLQKKYNAELKFDSFTSPTNINSWISKKTLNLIDNMLDDINPDEEFMLINALGIDMDWEEKFLLRAESPYYPHEKLNIYYPKKVKENRFSNNNKTISGMDITAIVHNYDIVNELGEDNIRKTVGEEYKKWAKNLNEYDWEAEYLFDNDLSDENIEKKTEEYLEKYMEEIDSNYHRVNYNTEFSFYVDDDIKAFAKDLKEYNNTTLQYVAIMPTEETLTSYIENTDASKINSIISNLRELKTENFKEGCATKIVGYIPKFKFEYDLDLINDLKEMGINDIFEQGKARLSNISDNTDIYVNSAEHKANIEFTQDGIKAAAATVIGGAGAGDGFDYLYDIPVEEIDLTFDKPYLFFIRDKETGEIWFTGTVYEPLAWDEEPEKNIDPRT